MGEYVRYVQTQANRILPPETRKKGYDAVSGFAAARPVLFVGTTASPTSLGAPGFALLTEHTIANFSRPS